MREYFVTYPKKVQYLLLAGDTAVVLISLLLAYSLRIYINTGGFTLQALAVKISLWLIIILAAYIICNYLLDLYNPNRVRFVSLVFFKICASVCLANILISTSFYFTPKFIYGRQVFLYNLIISIIALLCWRWIFSLKYFSNKISNRFALLGKIENINSFLFEITKLNLYAKNISAIGVIPSSSGTIDINCIDDSVFIYHKIDDFFSSPEYEVLLYDHNSVKFSDREAEHVMRMKFEQKSVFDFATYYKNNTGRIPLNFIDGNWLLQKEALQGAVNKSYVKIKRLLDVILAALLLIILLPLFFLIAIAVKLDSKGPAIFVQERLGMNKILFRCYKFRTMRQGAEEKSGPVWSKTGDERITHTGSILRKSRLDELPQLFNILMGDMSFIGPRPIRSYFAEKLAKSITFYDLRFSVQPGLSGWAQVSYGYAASEDDQREKFEYDLFYIQNVSFILDAMIVVKTFKTLFQVKGK